jgi:two-component system sensor histidine kinase HydH
MLVANVFTRLIRESSLLAPDFASYRRQESVFVVLNLVVLAVLLLIHTLFSSVFGHPPQMLFIVLGFGFLVNVIELIWLQGASFLSANAIVCLTWFCIALNMTLAFALASLSYRQDTQYFALLVAPILQAAFRLSFTAAMAVVAASTVLDFYWVWNYFRLHPPAQLSEYMEVATISLIYTIVGILVWTLVNHLRSKEAELERARERLRIEERLAAVGRLSSSIAHEIRNPVAMISSALATVFNGGLDPEQRQEMFEIAGKEAARLEKLTTDFLIYARPRAPVRHAGDVSELVDYVVDICRLRAKEKAVTIRAEIAGGLRADVDSGQVQQALLNLVINAVEASLAGGAVLVRGVRRNGSVAIEVENGNGPIPGDGVNRVFEPFFTTKASGTGLGLAIARNIASGHGGELLLSRNEADSIIFSFLLPACSGETDHA